MGAYYGLGLGLGGAPVPIRGSHLAVGGLVEQFPGAAAAYSLRGLRNNIGNVVNVRRSGDADGFTNEREFTPAQIESGELEDWVNGKLETTLPADVDTAAAAYSLRKVRNAYSGDAVQIRRTSDNVEVNVAFDSNGEVSDSSAISNVTESPDAGDTTATTLGDFIVPPSIQALYNQRVYFNGSNQNVVLGSQIDMTGDFSLQYSFIVSETNQQIIGRNTTGSYIRAFGSGSITAFRVQTEGGAVNLTLLSSINYNEAHTIKLKRISGSFGIYDESDVLISDTASNSDTFALGSFGRGRGTYAKGVIWNIRVDTDNDGTTDHSYNGYGNTLSDWEDQVGSNDGTVNGSPALFTGQDFEATVVTWYDQSGNGNDATQDTTGSQPKIAENGSLLADGIEFITGYLVTTSYIVELSQNNASVFSVAKPNASTSGFILSEADTAGGSSNFILGDAAGGFSSNSVLWVNGPTFGTKVSGESLMAFTYDGTNFQAYVNGAASGASGTATVNAEVGNKSTIGANYLGSTIFNGSIKEIITYKSDQSANREAIEANINGRYSIY